MPNIVELAALADEPMMDPPGLNEDLDGAITKTVLCLYRLVAIRYADLPGAPQRAAEMLARAARDPGTRFVGPMKQ